MHPALAKMFIGIGHPFSVFCITLHFNIQSSIQSRVDLRWHVYHDMFSVLKKESNFHLILYSVTFLPNLNITSPLHHRVK